MFARLSSQFIAKKAISRLSFFPRTRYTATKVFTGFATGVIVSGATFVYCAPAACPFDTKSIRSDIEDLISNNMALGPMFVRLAWHEAGSWDCKRKDGSPNSASMRFHPECGYGGNKGLDKPRKALEALKKKYPEISYADLWVLAAYVAIEYMGGPAIPFSWGRQDAKDGSVCGPDGRLPDASKTQDHVRDVFTRLGFTDKEAVALIGAHTCGECHLENSGFVGPWTHDKNGFDNSFFTALLEEKWEVNPKVANLQFMDDATKNLMML
ncbi:L-ascorbate peroxidase, partial [Angomonas deanei]